MHQRRGIPISRHAPCISPSESNPQIGLRRAPASGPSILRIGIRASPRLCACAVKQGSVAIGVYLPSRENYSVCIERTPIREL